MTCKLPGLRPVGWLPILALLLVATATAPARAQTVRDWIDPAGGNYDDTANWSSLNVPNTLSESARFNIVGTYDVVQSPFLLTTVSDLLVNDGDVTFRPSNLFQANFNTDDDAEIIGGDLTLAKLITSSVTLNVGGLLTVRGGSTLNVIEGSDVTVAILLDLALGGGAGTILVDGAGSSLTVSGSTFVGNESSTGTLTFQNGSTGNSLSGTVNLMAFSGVADSTGRMNILSASTLQTGSIVVGRSESVNFSQEGTLTVDGTDSTLTMTGASTLTVGDETNPNVVSDVIVSNSAVMSTGTGAILIQNSGRLDIQAGTFNANGNLTLDGGTININTDGTFNALGDIDLVGTINLNGGTLQLDSTALTGTGSLNYVTGSLRLRDVGGYTVGANSGLIDDLLGGSQVNLFNGKRLIVEESLTIPAATSLTVNAGSVTADTMVNNGLVLSTNSTVTTTSGLTNNADIILIDATVQGPLINAGGSTATVLGTVDFNGLVSGPGNFFGPGTANFNGGYNPGDTPGASPALIAFAGAVNFGAGNTLFIELGGLTPGSLFDALDIAGTLTAGGILDVSLINAFTPTAGDSFDLFDFGSLTGNFSAVNLPTLGGGLDWDTSSLLIDGTLSVIATVLLDGDLNADGFVGVDDLNIILINWNQNVTPGDLLAGDPSGEGFVGVDDLNIVLINWNNGTPPSAEALANIPEPGTLAMLGAGGLVMLRRRG